MNIKLISTKSRSFFNLFVIMAVLFSQLNASFKAIAADKHEAVQQPPAVAQQAPEAVSNPAERASHLLDEAAGKPLQVEQNQPPEIAQGDLLRLDFFVTEGGKSVELSLDAIDPENDPLTWSLMTPAKHGTAGVESHGASVSVDYAPQEGYEGVDVFAVQVIDSKGGKDHIVIEVTTSLAITPNEEKPIEQPSGDNHQIQYPELPKSELSNAASDPYIILSLGSYLSGYDWPLGNSLTLTIDDPSNGTGVDHTQTKTVVEDPYDPTGTRVVFDWPSIWVNVGDIVTMSDGTTTKTLSVALSASSFDASNERISGSSLQTNSVTVYVWIVDHWVCRSPAPDGSGNWSADFNSGDGCSSEVVDLVPGMNFWVYEWDPDDDFTQGYFNLYMEVEKRINVISGYGYPRGNTSFTLTIDDPTNGVGVDYTDTDMSQGYNYYFRVPEELLRLQAGQVVTVTDGLIVKTHIITSVNVTGFDTDADTISGVAEPGSAIFSGQVCEELTGTCTGRTVTADGSGNWTADYSVSGPNPGEEDTIDLVQGSSAWARETDSDDDSTTVYWRIPDPSIDVFVNFNEIYGREWQPGETLTLTIDDLTNGIGEDHTDTAVVQPGWQNALAGDAYFYLTDFQLQAGQLVTITDGSTTKTHTITGLTVTEVDADADTVSGTAEPGSQVEAGWLCNYYCTHRLVTADGSGNWTADYSSPGANPDETDTVDIVPGDSSNASQTDIEGNSTNIYWFVPNPVITVYKLEDRITGWEWIAGETVTLTIDDPSNGAGVDYTDTTIVDPYSWNTLIGSFQFDLNSFTLQPGQIVTITNGTLTKTHTITSLTVTEINPITDTVSGTAEPGSEVFVGWLCDPSNCTIRYATANGAGLWVADFSIPGSSPDEADTFDIVPGVGAWADQEDSDGDYTSVYWHLPYPTSISGTVNDADGNPITGVAIRVRAVQKSDWSEWGWTTSNPADGTYTLTDLPFDTDLAVIASDEDPDADGYSGEFYNNVDGLDWAETIVLTSSAPDRTGVDFNLSMGEGASAEHLTFNSRTGRLLNDVNLRKAIAYGTDRQAILDNAFVPNGLVGEILNSMVMPGVWFEAVETDLTIYNYNQITAENLLTAAGWTDTDLDGIRENASNEELSLDFVTTQAPVRVASADLFKTQMASIGILVNVTTYPGSDFFSGDPARSPLDSGDFDIAQFAWVLTDKDNLLNVYNTGDPENYGGYSNASLDNYFNDARDAKVTGDLTAFEDNALNWQYTFSNNLPDLPMFTRYQVPNPRIEVAPFSDWIHAREWPLGTEITMMIDDPSHGTGADYTETATMQQNPWNLGDPNDIGAFFGWPDQFTPGAGYIITMSGDNGQSETYTVTNLRVTGFDLDADTVFGTATPDAEVQVGACFPDHCANRYVTADGSGNWVADFQHAGSRDDEQEIVDLEPWMNGWSAEPDNDGDQTWFDWVIPNPNFSVRANFDQIEIREWPFGDTVSYEIDDPGTTEDPDWSGTKTVDGYASWNPSQTYVSVELGGIYDIQPGFEVSVSDGDTTKTTTVTNLAFTNVNPATDVVSGVAQPGVQVDVWACGNDGCPNRHVMPDGDGNWSVDFAHPGTQGDEQDLVDIGAGTWIDSQQFDDDSDTTMFGQSMPNPRFDLRANDDRVEAYEWPLGNIVTLEIDDPLTVLNPDFSTTRSIILMPWDNSQTYAEYNLWEIFDIQPGFEVRMSDGSITKTLTVSLLEFTDVDVDADLVSGVADPDVRVNVWACDWANCYNRHDITDGSGNWSVDFTQPGTEDNEQVIFNIVNGTWIDSNQADNDGDNTMYGMNVSLPTIEVNPGSHWVHARGNWPDGTLITMTIDNPITPQLVDYTSDATFGQNPGNPGDPNDRLADFDMGIFNLEAGQTITMIGGGITKIYIIQPLEVTGFDLDADTISGTGVSGHQLQVCVNNMSGNCSRHVSIRSNGTWMADYQNPGSRSDEQDTANIHVGSNGWVTDYQDDGDQTTLDWLATLGFPFVTSINRLDANPTSAASVQFAVTFSEAVTGVDDSDFNLATTGITGAAITGVTGSGTDYTVTVSTGSGNGTIRLNLFDNDSIIDTESNLLVGLYSDNGNFTNGQTYAILKPDGALPRDKTLYFNGQQWGSVGGWNPYSSYMNNAMAIAQQDNARVTMFETPYIFNMIDGKVYPLLADGPWSWNTEMTEITFQLNAAAHWSDDTPVTAEDVVYTWATHVTYGTSVGTVYQDFIDTIEAIGPQTVLVKAKLDGGGNAVNPLMVVAYLSSNYVIQKAWTQTLEERTGFDADALLNDPAEDVIWSGPYTKFLADDTQVVLIRDDDYWGQDASMWGSLPTPKYLAHIIYADNDTGFDAFRAGEVDVSQQFMANVQDLWLVDGLPVSTYYPDAPYNIGASLPTAFYNLGSYGLDQVAVRKAIAIAVDYDAIIANAMTDQSETFEQAPRSIMNPTPGEQALYDSSDPTIQALQWAGNDIASANALLDAAGIIDTNADGWREYNGQTLHYVATCPNGWTDWQAAIEIVAAAGQAIGIDITTNYPEWSDYQNVVTNAPLPNTGYDIFMMWSDGAGPTQPWGRVRQLISSEFAGTTGNWYGNWGGYSNPAVDALIQAIPGETDPDTLKGYYTDLTEIYLTDVPSFTLMYRPQSFHTVNESIWTGFPHLGDGTNPPVPPLDLTDGYSIAGLYNLTVLPFTLTVLSDHGTVVKNPDQATYQYGDVVELTATADAGYTFANWSGDATGTSNTVSVVMDGHKSITANYAPITYTISGNAGVAYATLSYDDGGPKTATADASGMYALTVSYNWTGTVTPSKAGYTFEPDHRDYSNVLADQTSQHYTATAITYTISGNAGVGGATVSYTGGSTTANGSGDYTFIVSYNWSGTVTPSMVGYTFTPDHKDYANVMGNQTGQDYIASLLPATFTISGNAGVGGAVINYTGGTTTADGGGAYIITVPYNWSGTVTPTKPGYSFTPPNRSYASITSNQTLQNFTAAAVATFGDVPTNYWSWNYIERLYAAGITGGCGGGNYCPEATVTRAQMAVFLERGMRGRSYSPPLATGTVFGDIPVSYWSAAWIEKLSSDGITGGCGGGNYCPEASVTRAQMAVFLLRAKHGASYSPPPATGDFGDVPTSYWAASWIEQLTAEGITSGCGGGNYCPEQPVSRAQMAVFLVRTFNLP